MSNLELIITIYVVYFGGKISYKFKKYYVLPIPKESTTVN